MYPVLPLTSSRDLARVGKGWRGGRASFRLAGREVVRDLRSWLYTLTWLFKWCSYIWNELSVERLALEDRTAAVRI